MDNSNNAAAPAVAPPTGTGMQKFGDIVPPIPVDLSVTVDVTFNKLWLAVIAVIVALTAMCMYMWVSSGPS